jgi:outer membrane protein assembly factor BamB
MLTVALIAALAQENWPQFRGPQALGVSDDAGIPDTWSATENVVWKTPIPGLGWSSPIVWGKTVVVTSVVSSVAPETPRKGLYFRGERPAPTDEHRWMVMAVDFETGRVRWEREVHRGVPPGPRHLKNTYASETPVTDGRRIYAYFGNVGVFCFDLEGALVWKKSLGAFKMRYGWGSASSPALHQNRLYIVCDNEERSFLVALDAGTGEEVWRVDRDEASTWATPYVWENERRAELVTPGSKRVRSYDLDGKLLWEFSGMSNIAIPTPFSKFGLLYIASGYVGDAHRPIYAVRPGGAGDISIGKDETSNASIAWHLPQAGPYNPTPLVYGDHLYTLFDFGFLTCHDAKTGQPVYGKQRIEPRANAFTASPWAAGGKVFCLSEDGDTFVIQAGPEYKKIRTNALGEMCMATPAMARGSLFIRTAAHLYRLGRSRK